jgi:hypothetical protein
LQHLRIQHSVFQHVWRCPTCVCKFPCIQSLAPWGPCGLWSPGRSAWDQTNKTIVQTWLKNEISIERHLHSAPLVELPQTSSSN